MVPLLPSRPSRVDFVSSRALTSSVVSSDAFILSMSLNLTETLILVLYFFVLSILAIYGWHRYYLVYLYMKHKGNAPKPLPEPATLPVVTIQLPIFNEMYVADRLIGAVCEMA